MLDPETSIGFQGAYFSYVNRHMDAINKLYTVKEYNKVLILCKFVSLVLKLYFFQIQTLSWLYISYFGIVYDGFFSCRIMDIR